MRRSGVAAPFDVQCPGLRADYENATFDVQSLVAERTHRNSVTDGHLHVAVLNATTGEKNAQSSFGIHLASDVILPFSIGHQVGFDRLPRVTMCRPKLPVSQSEFFWPAQRDANSLIPGTRPGGRGACDWVTITLTPTPTST
eukprot:4343877-Pyramimonas_sp.AAC.1